MISSLALPDGLRGGPCYLEKEEEGREKVGKRREKSEGWGKRERHRMKKWGCQGGR